MSNFALSRKGGVIVKDLRESFTWAVIDKNFTGVNFTNSFYRDTGVNLSLTLILKD